MARNLRSDKEGPELFDDAESNMNEAFNQPEIDFPDSIKSIKKAIDELRKHEDNDNLVPAALKMSATNVYIENAMLIAKKNNMIDVSSFSDLTDEEGLDHRSRRARELLETNLSDINRIGRNRDSDRMNSRFTDDLDMKVSRDEGLLSLAEQGKLFDIKIDNIYKSVGPTQVKNFAKMYGVKQ